MGPVRICYAHKWITNFCDYYFFFFLIFLVVLKFIFLCIPFVYSATSEEICAVCSS